MFEIKPIHSAQVGHSLRIHERFRKYKRLPCSRDKEADCQGVPWYSSLSIFSISIITIISIIILVIIRTRQVCQNGGGSSSSQPVSTWSPHSSSPFAPHQLSRSHFIWLSSEIHISIIHLAKYWYQPHHVLKSCQKCNNVIHEYLQTPGVQLQVVQGVVHMEILHFWRCFQVPCQRRTTNNTSSNNSSATSRIIKLST